MAFSIAAAGSVVVYLVVLGLAMPYAGPVKAEEVLRSTLAVLTLIGAVFAGVYAYRKQRIAESEADRADDKQLAERYTTAAEQLGHGMPAVRLAGVYTLAWLADDWLEQRQVCIDVLCAYLRMPYEPDPTLEGKHKEGEQEVRHTIIRVIREHLKSETLRSVPSWSACRFDFTRATFDGGDLSGSQFGGSVSFDDAEFRGGTFSFEGARFGAGSVSFNGAMFRGGCQVDFGGARFTGGTVNFDNAKFNGGTISFDHAKFNGGTISFSFAKFNDGMVSFDNAEFNNDGVVDFGCAEFNDGMVHFDHAKFSGGRVSFSVAKFNDGMVHFLLAKFTGATVSFGFAKFNDGVISFGGAEFTGGRVSFDYAEFDESRVSFDRAKFTGGTVSFDRAKVARRAVSMLDVNFTLGSVSFDGSEFGGTVMHWGSVSPPEGWTE
ncbi:pentapeptide repeat-containing protein [Streptomyces sp. NPDC002073]